MVLLLLGILVCLLLIICIFHVYDVVFYSPKKKRSTIDTPLIGAQYEAVSEHLYKISHIMEKFPCKHVVISSFDGCALHGRYYHIRNSAPVMILFHGYRGCAFRDCSGFHALSRKIGFNALVVDQRAHGNSEGSTITFGIKEQRDCLCWINYCNDRFGMHPPIILCGLSMGAATVLMATALSLPDNVCCVIADSAYSAPIAIIEKVCKDLRYPVPLCKPLIKLSARLLGRFQLNASTAKESVAHAKIPILLIHGEDDLLVPYSMSFEIAETCSSNSSVHIFPHAGHGLSYMTDPVRYEKIVCDFLLSIPSIRNEIDDSFLNQFSDEQA